MGAPLAGRMGLKVLPGVAGGGTPCSGFVSPVKRLTKPRTSGRAPSSGSVAFVKRLTKLTKPRTSGARYAIALLTGNGKPPTTSQRRLFTKLYDTNIPDRDNAKAAVECATRLDAVPVLVLIIKCCHQIFFVTLRFSFYSYHVGRYKKSGLLAGPY